MGNVIVKTVVIFFTLLTLMRLLGKRQLGELELSELVVSILIADVASVPLQSPDLSIWYGLVPCAVLFVCEYLLALVTMKSVAARRVICGKPCFLVVRGVIRQQEMRRCRFTVDELAEELRKKDVADLSEVEYAVLETDGTLNVILFPAHRAVTAAQMSVPVEDNGYGVVLVEDGTVLEENLRFMGRDRLWLDGELRVRNCDGPEGAYAFILYESGKIYFAPREGT